MKHFLVHNQYPHMFKVCLHGSKGGVSSLINDGLYQPNSVTSEEYHSYLCGQPFTSRLGYHPLYHLAIHLKPLKLGKVGTILSREVI